MSQLKSYFLLTLLGFLGMTLHSQAQTLEDYPWVSSLIDQQNCCFNEQVQLYSFGMFDFIYIANDVDCAGKGGVLYSGDGTLWCTATPSFDCLSFYNFNLEGDLFTCNQSSELDLLSEYSWLSGVINENDCCTNSTVSLYANDKGHEYLLVSPDPSCSNAYDKWYRNNGQLYCESGPGYDCVSLYGFSDMEIIATWNCGEGPVQELTNEEKAIAVINGLETGDLVAFSYISDDQYIQHNLAFPSGKEVLAGFFTGEPTGITTEIHRSFEVGDFVILHTTYGGAWGAIAGSNSDQVAFDVFRFENGLIVEHWDNLSNVVDDMDGTSQTDGAVTPATDLESTDANQALLEEMAQTLFVNGDWTNLNIYFNLDAYIQHSVGAGADGAFLATLEGATGVSFYDDVKFVHTLGNFGLVMSQGPDIYGVDLEGTYAYYDLFRMEDGLIVEHWDVIQLIPPQDQWANNNGKWGDDAILPINVPENLSTDDADFFPEDIVIANNVAYVSGLGDGTVKMFDLSLENPTGEIFAEAEAGYTQAWGLKSDGTVLVSLLNNADFSGGPSGDAKLVEYDIASGAKTGEWGLPAGAIGHTVSIVDGKYYVTDFGNPRIMEIDPSTGTVNDSWFTSPDWDPTISGIGGTIYNNDGAFYVSQGNKLWYLPINSGTPGTLQEVTVSGLDAIDADGISWSDSDNTLYYATNDTGDPANVGTAYKLVFSDATTATGSVVANGFDDSSGLWFYENDGNKYVFVLESQFGALFGLNAYEPPFNIAIITLD